MRANRITAVAGSYAMSNLGGAAPAAPATSCQSTTPCSPTDLAAWDLYIWQTRLAQYGGSGQIVMAGPVGLAGLNSSYTGAVAIVTVQWDDAPAQRLLGGSTNATGGTANLAQIVLNSQL